MPLTAFQKRICRLLAPNRSPESHLAGGAAIHFAPNSQRYSVDIDYFHDSEKFVALAFRADKKTFEAAGFQVEIQLDQPGFIRALVSRAGKRAKIEWARDSAWRFMPPIKVPGAGYQLHPVDLAINKVLALAGRDEARDFLDILFINDKVLPLGALCWAAPGKDPGFTPLSLLELLKRRGRAHPADLERLRLKKPANLPSLKSKWLKALEFSERFIRLMPPKEMGCLYYSPSKRRFIAPENQDHAGIVPHFGRPGGILPRMFSGDLLSDLIQARGGGVRL